MNDNNNNKIDFGRILDKAREALGLPQPAADSSTAEELLTYVVVGAAKLTRSTIDQSKAWWESAVEAAKKRAAELEAEVEVACSDAAVEAPPAADAAEVDAADVASAAADTVADAADSNATPL
jgi:hypothetical protein